MAWYADDVLKQGWLNEDDVLKQAMVQPEEFVAWTPDDIINQPLKDVVMAAVLKARPHATVGQVMDILNEARSRVYDANLRALTPRVSIMGIPFAQFKGLTLVSRRLGVDVGELSAQHCPAKMTGPADIVYSTMYLKRAEVEKAATIARMKDMMEKHAAKMARESSSRPVINPSQLGGLAKPRGAVAGPAPKDDAGTGVDTTAPATSPKGKEKAQAAPDSEGLLEMTLMRLMLPKWPRWPGFPHHECGMLDIPFPPGRNWETCYEIPSGDLYQFTCPAVQIDCQVIGEGFRKLVVRLGDQQAATPFNSLELARFWCAVVAWAQQLIKRDEDIPISDYMSQFFAASTRHDLEKSCCKTSSKEA